MKPCGPLSLLLVYQLELPAEEAKRSSDIRNVEKAVSLKKVSINIFDVSLEKRTVDVSCAQNRM